MGRKRGAYLGNWEKMQVQANDGSSQDQGSDGRGEDKWVCVHTGTGGG